MDYSQTLNLPQTDFPMKASLTTREPEQQLQWEQMNIYQLLRKQMKGKAKFILHDGPPYANGDVHLGTAFNKISKDLVIRYKSMRGFDAPYIPGWDCHGMPIEHKVVSQLSESEAQDRQRVRQECRAYAARFVEHQRRQFKRLGIFGDWDQPYLTMDPHYQSVIVKTFGELVSQGYIYRGLKPVYWCINCQSALAEAEVEYADHVSPSITVRFEVISGWPAGLGERPAGKVYMPIWTTTPWTLPANRAVAIHPEHTYVLLESAGEHYIVAKERVAPNWESWGQAYTVKAEVPGHALVELKLLHPFLPMQVPVLPADHVTLDAGTGCVHTAPGHGQEDFRLGQAFGLEVFNPVGPDGRFTSLLDDLQGELVFKADEKIIARLRERGALMRAEHLTHSYPHCWRHRTPIIFRATEQWFMNVDRDGFRQRVLHLIQNEVTWVPAVSQNRIETMVENRPDWCLSRQRAWGVPLPVMYCETCHAPLLQAEVFKHVENLIRAENADAWFTRTPAEILPPDARCPHCQGNTFRKETDILDVWFDSGVSHAAVLAKRKELKFPAELYLEGSDQHRGWFQVSLLTAAATTGKAPYRAVLTHGYTVDGEGRKMSKSLGNYVGSMEAIERSGGADILRLWVTSENVQNDVRFSDEILKRLVDAYRRFRNTFRFLLGNLHGFHPARALKRKDVESLDRLMLHRLHTLTHRVTEAFEAYEFHRVYQLLLNFCASDLSAFYFDVLKDRLYADPATETRRLSAQTTLWHMLGFIVRMLAPILPHTTEEVWDAMQKQGLHLPDQEKPSVHLASWPMAPKDWLDPEFAQTWEELLVIRAEVMKQLEEARNQKLIRHAYEASVRIRARGKKRSLLATHQDLLAEVFVVSDARLEDSGSAGPEMLIWIEKAQGKKCARCWRILPTVGEDKTQPDLCRRCGKAIPAPLSAGPEKEKSKP